MKKFLISESEKQQILGMHKRAVRKEWVLNEASDDDGSGEKFTKLGIRSIAGSSSDFGPLSVGSATLVQLVDVNGITLLYNCIRDPRASKKEVDASPTLFKTGSLIDLNYKDVKNNTRLTGNWEPEVQKYCSSAYRFVNNWRAENCPKLNATTHWDYNNQCSIYMKNQAAEKQQQAQAQVDAQKAESEAKIAATQAANLKAAQEAKAIREAPWKKRTEEFQTSFNQLFEELSDLVEGYFDVAEQKRIFGTQQDIETKINQLQALYDDPKKRSVDADIKKALKFIPKYIQDAKAIYPTMTATFVK